MTLECATSLEEGSGTSPFLVRYAPHFAIGLGSIMVLYWVVSFAVSEPMLMADLAARPWDMGLRLVAEVGTAIVLVAGGWAALSGHGWVVLVLGLGMLLYTLVATTGWSLEEGVPAISVAMVLLFVVTVAIVASIAYEH